MPFNLYIDPLFNLHEWIALACYEAIEVSYAALIWLLFLAMGDIEVVIAEGVDEAAAADAVMKVLA